MKRIINAIKRFAMEKRKAFTLIELMGVLVIIGILTVILIPVINNTIKNNREELYNKQLSLIKLSAKNLASDNEYILPEEEGEEIYVTLGQLRAMGYAEETIINPKTKENFPDNLVVMIIKVGKDYDYDIILDGGETLTTSGIIVYNPSKTYIKKGSRSSYIITAKTKTQVDLDTMEYYVDVTKSNIVLQGVGETDSSVKYKLDGNKGLYKLTVVGGEKEGYLYFNFVGLKDVEGKEIDTTTINRDINNVSNNKQIMVDNTAPVINFTTNGTSVWAKSVGTKITVTDNSGSNSLDSSTYKYLYSLSSSQTQVLKNTYNLTSTVSQTSGDGEYYLIAQACDKAGNCARKTSNKFLVDNTAPTCNWSGENSTWSASAQTIKLTGTDNHKMNSSKTSYTKTYNQSGVELATDSLSYEIEDEAGNKRTCSKTVSVYYDTKKPSITYVNNESNEEWTNKDFKVSLTVTEDGSGIGEEQYSYQSNTGWTKDNATISGNTVTTSNFSAERDQLAYIRVCDKVGNCSSQVSTRIRIDKTAPVITNVNNKSGGNWTNENFQVILTVTENGSGIDEEQYSYQSNTGWTKDSATISGNTVTTAYFSKERNQLAYIRVCDKAGNCSSQVSTQIRIDKTKPSISASVGSCSGDKRTISIKATDSSSGISGYAITTSSSTPSSFSSSSSGSYSAGTYYVWAKDNAGNINSTTVTVANCITSADICSAGFGNLFGTYKGNLSGNFGSYYTNLNPSGKWGNWCEADGTTCSPTTGYDIKCVGSTCSTYGIYGLTAVQINDTYGCSYAKYWCSCKGAF